MEPLKYELLNGIGYIYDWEIKNTWNQEKVIKISRFFWDSPNVGHIKNYIWVK